MGVQVTPRSDGWVSKLLPDGRIGSNPALAGTEHGKRLYDAALEDAMDAWREFVASASS